MNLKFLLPFALLASPALAEFDTKITQAALDLSCTATQICDFDGCRADATDFTAIWGLTGVSENIVLQVELPTGQVTLQSGFPSARPEKGVAISGASVITFATPGDYTANAKLYSMSILSIDGGARGAQNVQATFVLSETDETPALTARLLSGSCVMNDIKR